MSSCYSNRPLVKKLGIKEGNKVRFVNVPENYFELLGELPEVEILKDNSNLSNFIHLFIESVEQFENQFFRLKDEIERDGMIWVS